MLQKTEVFEVPYVKNRLVHKKPHGKFSLDIFKKNIIDS
jgi:hypothetical protein